MEKFYVVESKAELEQVNLVNGVTERHNPDVISPEDLFKAVDVDADELVDFRLDNGNTLLIPQDLSVQHCKYSCIGHTITITGKNESFSNRFKLDWDDEINHLLVEDYTC